MSDERAIPNSTDHFNLCFFFTMKEEGGPNDYKSNTEGDAGGRTVCGVAESAHSKELLDKLWNLSYEEALLAVKPIYWREYWLPIGGPSVADAHYAVCLFDVAVNSGVNRANSFKQVYEDVVSICNARISMLDRFYPNGYWLTNEKGEKYDALPILKERVERCRNWTAQSKAGVYVGETWQEHYEYIKAIGEKWHVVYLCWYETDSKNRTYKVCLKQQEYRCP